MFVEQIEEHTTHGGVVLQQTPFDQDVMTVRVAWCLMGSGLSAQHPAPKFLSQTETTMSTIPTCPRFPPEISDYIVDIIHGKGNEQTLKLYCLISKSWVPRTRRHLFASVAFWSYSDINACKEVFPNPSNSPAHYTRSLFFDSMQLSISESFTEGDSWIRAFHNVVQLELQNGASTCISIPSAASYR